MAMNFTRQDLIAKGWKLNPDATFEDERLEKAILRNHGYVSLEDLDAIRMDDYGKTSATVEENVRDEIAVAFRQSYELLSHTLDKAREKLSFYDGLVKYHEGMLESARENARFWKKKVNGLDTSADIIKGLCE